MNRIAAASAALGAVRVPVHSVVPVKPVQSPKRPPSPDSSVTVTWGASAPDTSTAANQTGWVSVLGKLEKELAASGLTFADVVKMNVFLVGDPAKGGRMDFEGLMKAYTRYIGAASQGRLPARTTVQVAGLPLPGALVEIEVVAARAP